MNEYWSVQGLFLIQSYRMTSEDLKIKHTK